MLMHVDFRQQFVGVERDVGGHSGFAEPKVKEVILKSNWNAATLIHIQLEFTSNQLELESSSPSSAGR
eukprot:7333277-Alexandrium_andersonii.AAC.1